MGRTTTTWILKLVEKVTGPIKKVGRSVQSTERLYVGLQRTARRAMSIIGIGALSVTSLMAGASTSTAQFKNEFLELENLNLTKTGEQIDTLNSKVLRTAFDAGLTAQATSKAYFDMQSATGLYGSEVDKTVNKVGRFGIAVKANNDALVNATAKSMGIWKFGSDQVDNYLSSMAKTVQVGVTTFDQLAQVQVDYAGAGAAANQTFDQANKLFAVFTKSSKSVAEAATSTKTAFMGLTDPRVQKGLKEYGINLFNTKGEMLAIDDIASQLVGTVGKMDGIQFSNFMGKVGGPEGFKILLQQAKANGDGLLQTFKDFDSTEFDIGKAIKNANKDAVILTTQIKNRLNTAFIVLGERALPTVISGLEMVNGFLESTFNWFDQNGQLAIDTILSIADGAKFAAIAFGAWLIVTNGMTIAFGILSAIMAINPIGAMIVGISLLIALISRAWRRSEKFRGVILGIVEAFKSFGSVMKEHVLSSIGKILSGLGGLGKAFVHLVKGQFGQAKTAASEAKNNLFSGFGGITPHGMAKATLEAGKAGAKGFEDGFSKGFGQVVDKKFKNKEFSLFKSPENSVDINSVVPSQEGSDTGSGGGSSDAPALSGSGSGSGKSLSVVMNFNQTFNAVIDDFESKLKDGGDAIISIAVDALNDVIIQNS